MKLPNAHLAIVDPRKVVEYLLNPAHPDNGGKARFFAMLGYTTDTAELLVDAMRAIAVTDEAARRRFTAKYMLSTDGFRRTLDRDQAGWFERSGSSVADGMLHAW